MRLRTTLLSLAAALPCLVQAGSPALDKAVVSTAPTDLGKDLFSWLASDDLGLLHRDKDATVLNELWWLGRYHGQYHWTDGSAGNDEGYESRRFRVGAQAKLFKKLTLHAQMVSAQDLESLYGGFTELWAGWQFNDALTLTVGQQKHRFTHDRNVSSRYISFLERGMLTNMFALDYTPAVTLQGKIGKVQYYTGLFSNATGTDMGAAFTEFDSGWSYLASAYVDLGKSLGTDTAHLNLGYVHSEANELATNLNRWDNGVNAALILTKGRASLIAEATAGLGSDKGDAYGITISPTYMLTNKLQLVGRYQLASSNNPEGLRAQRRYERNVGMAYGDLYQAGYAGVNYYLSGHRVKLMTGIEYATIGGNSSWTASTMLRFFWGPHSKAPFPASGLLKAD